MPYISLYREALQHTGTSSAMELSCGNEHETDRPKDYFPRDYRPDVATGPPTGYVDRPDIPTETPTGYVDWTCRHADGTTDAIIPPDHRRNTLAAEYRPNIPTGVIITTGHNGRTIDGTYRRKHRRNTPTGHTEGPIDETTDGTFRRGKSCPRPTEYVRLSVSKRADGRHLVLQVTSNSE